MSHALALVVALVAAAQQPALVRDINTAPSPTVRSSSPESAVTVGPVTFFPAERYGFGIELWRTEGRPGTTSLVRDIAPGDRSSWPQNLTPFRGGLLFFAADPASGREPWWSDGTEAGTRLVADIVPGPSGTQGYGFTVSGGHAYFMADDTIHGRELWRTDGTTAGTHLVLDILPGSGTSNSGTRILPLGGGVVFTASDGVHGVEPWFSDGTAAGTRMITDLEPGPNSSNAGILTSSSSRAWLATWTSAAGREIAYTDGTGGGTRVLDVVPGPSGTEPQLARPRGNDVVFVGGQTRELWYSDGTVTGTRPLFARGSGPERIYELAQFGSRILFHGHTAATGPELGITDGTALGTTIFDLEPGTAGSSPGHFVTAGSAAFFRTFLNRNLVLWRTDGTRAGTLPVLPLAEGGHLLGATAAASLLFRNSEPATGSEPWISDGTTNGTGLLADVNPNPVNSGSQPKWFAPYAAGALFAANDGVHGTELWHTDGTAAGTRLVADVVPGAQGSAPYGFTATGGLVFFLYNPSPRQTRVGVTDGTARGTRVLGPKDKSIGSGLARTWPGRVVFVTSPEGDVPPQLWETDGSVPGTRRVLDLPQAHPYFPAMVYELDGRRAVIAVNIVLPRSAELLVFDSVTGTVQPLRTLPGPGPAGKGVAVRGTLYFLAPGATSLDLWRTDGTPTGTARLGAAMHDLLATPNRLYSLDRSTLFVGDTIAPMRAVAPLANGRFLGAVGDDALCTDSHELIRSDGTPAGTTRIPGPAGQPVGDLGFDQALFVTTPLLDVHELWTTDGTAAGTKRVALARASRVAHAGLSQGQVLFGHDDGTHGVELWRVAAGAVAEPIEPACGPGYPELRTARPRIGTVVGIEGRISATAPVGALWIGAPVTTATGLALPRGCALHLDDRGPVVVVSLAAGARWSLPARLPNRRALVGRRLALQAAWLTSGGIALSNGVAWTLGT